jgi:hypothetical protein
MRRCFGLLFPVMLVWAGLPALAGAQGKPTAEQILDNYVEKTGGKAAHLKIKNRVIEGTIEVGGANLSGPLKTYEAEPNLMYMEAEIGGIGKIERGTDGKVGWERNAITGPRVLEGEEKKMAVDDSLFHGDVEWRKIFTKTELGDDAKVEGKDCYCVIATSKSGQTSKRFYDKATGLLVMMQMSVNTPMGNVDSETIMADYKEVDGVKIPHKLTQRVLTQEIIITAKSIKHNVDMPKNRFDLPEDIKKLVK